MAIRFHQLDLNLLVALDALLTECSITGAARRLNLSQSATSGVLARLREFFDDDLLVQVGRTMMPTPLGTELVGRARQVLQTIHSTIVTRSSFDHRTSHRHFRIGAWDFVKTVLLAPVAQRLSEIAPNITLDIVHPEDCSAGPLDRGELDLLIMPEDLLDKTRPKLTLFESRHVCALWTGNPLVGDSLSFEQFVSLGHVVIRFGKTRAPGFEEWFIERFGHTRRIEVITDDYTSMAQLIPGTLRIATLHERLGRFYAEKIGLKLLPPPIEIPPMNETMQWHEYLDGDQGHAWLRQLIHEVAQGETVREAAGYAGGTVMPSMHAASPARTS
jgi:DNA-binding transcriptional LysR family regulator